MTDPRLRAAPDVTETSLPDELILLDPTSGEMFTLNGTAALAWHAMRASPAGLTEQELIEMILDAFAADRDEVCSDIRAFVRRLKVAGLILDDAT